MRRASGNSSLTGWSSAEKSSLPNARTGRGVFLKFPPRYRRGRGSLPRIAAVSWIKCFAPEESGIVYRAGESEEPFTVRVEDGVFIVEGPWIKNLIESVNLSDYESSQYFQRIIRKKGLIQKLEELGIREQDTVRIYDTEFDYYV